MTETLTCECGCDHFHIRTHGVVGKDDRAIDTIECADCSNHYDHSQKPTYIHD